MSVINAPLSSTRNVINAPLSTAKSAYRLWLDVGNTGSLVDFLNSLIGPPGPAAIANISADPALGTSDTLAPSQAAVKSYVDAHTTDVVSSPTPPTDTTSLWLDSTDWTLAAWNGSAWVVI